ncbi:MAG: hypothetical protein FWC38_03530 [Proteobacteria bacterium]|nr:hypothetical protein [Pseudomonadota bacterium]MCL2307299.1 hypothetical protein [Pseudomonadota bacterium]
MEDRVRLDLSSPGFIEAFQEAEKTVQEQVKKAIEKLSQMSWTQVYKDRGLKWEKIYSLTPPQGVDALYTFRISRSCRAVAYRKQDFLVVLTFDPDHDSAYGRK